MADQDIRRIIFFTDFPAGGSGYATICQHICTGLSHLGYDVIVIGLSNNGEEHWFPFSVIPVASVGEAHAAIHNLNALLKPDLLIVGLDIPLQEQFYQQLRQANINLKYVAITPMENGPLMQSWAMALSQLSHVFFISELGKIEAEKVGMKNVSHLKIGMDGRIWYPATHEERKIARQNLGYAEDEKVVLTVADNQERKNLWAGMRIVSNLKKSHPELKLKYVIVTKQSTPYGWRLMELASTEGISGNVILYERGMPVQQLRLLYVCSDAFLLPSKAEGLGLPALEAMSCGLPVVATDTGALHELLDGGIGWPVPPVYTFTDVWGNSKRDMIDTEIGAEMLLSALNCSNERRLGIANHIAVDRKWEDTVIQFKEVIDRIIDEKQA